jgi:C1A family cysteine protease
MKTIAALTALSTAAALQPVLDSSLSIGQEFDRWADTYGKNYDTTNEKSLRQQVFQKNRDVVIKHNAEYDNGVHSFNLELNHLADLTNTEYQQKMLAFSSDLATSAASTYDAPNGTAPAAWDWRNHSNVVNPVKNQGSCGSCWAFSAVATMEGAYNLKQGKLNSFSEQELVDCVNNGTSTCSVGGEMYQGVEYGIANGMMAEADYAYKGSSGGGCKFDKSKIVTKFSGYSNITSGDEDALKFATYKQPIISVGIDASSIWFQLYFGGVFNVKSCKNTADQLDHGVAVVGYGTDPKSSKDYWWVRNSWGAFWGKSGYIMMSRNADNQCGIATQACFAEL